MLFNKDGRGSEELSAMSGTFESSVPFRAIATEIDAAERHLSGLVGDDVMQKASEIYAKNTASTEELEFLDMVRRPVAFLAIANYSKITGLRHGSTGRRMVVGDNEKIPFEWMIDRDDREMKERYFRALDTLFNYLTKAGNPEWEKSDTHKKAASCLVPGLTELEEVYPVNQSQYTYVMLLPLLLEKQRVLEGLVGQEGFNRIKEGEESERLLPNARKFIVLKALVAALKRWSIAVFPTEVARQFAPTYQGNQEKRVATIEEIEWTISKMEDEIADAQAELMTDLTGNPYEGFPLIPKNDPRNKYFTV